MARASIGRALRTVRARRNRGLIRWAASRSSAGWPCATCRLRRAVLSTLTIAIAATGIFAVLTVHAITRAEGYGAGNGRPPDPEVTQVDRVVLVFTVTLVVLAAVNVLLITQATVQDTKRLSAVSRTLGVTPAQAGAAVSVTQLLPAVISTLASIPAGYGLVVAVNSGGSTVFPPLSWLVAVVLGTLLAIFGLTLLPAWAAARRPVAEVLRAERA